MLAPRRVDKRAWIALSVILAVFVLHALSLNFTQDDAYISYRYVENFVAGHGLVFNPGERVEGYTNFLWIIILALFARFGLDPISVSKILGVASGCLSVVVLYRISRLYFSRAAQAAPGKTGKASSDRGHAGMTPDSVWLLACFPPLLLAVNGSFAYWSVSGLETPLFVLGVLATLYFYIAGTGLAAILAAVTTLVRPEGALVFIVLIVHEVVVRRVPLKRTALDVAVYTLLLLPFLAFRVRYYGDILPNPFYAKTGLSPDYLHTGVSYFGRFLKHYGFLGAIYVLPVVTWRHLRREGRLLWMSACAFSIYVILVGGDVLRGHRFFLPVVPLLYVLLVFSVATLTRRLAGRGSRRAVRAAILIACAIATFGLPRGAILEARRYELGFNANMTRYAERLKAAFGTDFTLATTTIGVISYLTEATVIDMLGLTDPVIAKHPEVIPGLTSTWKERKFNSGYLLSKDPDIIMFSTGLKPSAPAEKALFLHSKFRGNYYLYSFRDIQGHVYKRKGDYAGVDEVYPDPTFVDLYSQAIYLGSTEQRYQACLDKLDQMLDVMPEDFSRAYEFIGTVHVWMGDTETAKTYALRAVEMDQYSIEAHSVLHDIYLSEGNKEAAQREEAAIAKYNPEVIRHGRR